MKNLRAKIGIGFDVALLTAAILIALSAFIGWCMAAPPATSNQQPATAPALLPAAKLQAMVATVKPGGSLVLPAGDYEVTDALQLAAQNTTFDFRQARFVKATPGPGHSPQMFDVQAAGIEVLGGTYDSPYPCIKPNGQNQKVNVYAFIVRSTGFVGRDQTFKNIDTGFLLFPGQRYTRLFSPHFTSELRGDGVYCGGADETLPRGELTLYDGRFDDSQQEHGLRCSTSGFSELVCVNCVFANHNNKEPFTVRSGTDIRCYNCTFDSTMGVYLGEGAGTSSCGDFLFRDCVLTGGGFWNVRNGVQGVLIDGGSIDIPVNPAKPGSETVCLSAYAGSTNIVLQNLTRRVIGGVTTKPFYRDYTGQPAGKGVVDGGGNASENVK